MFLYLLIPLLAVAHASAHGFVASITVDGNKHKGPQPGSYNTRSVIRAIDNFNPVHGVSNPALNCGPEARPAEDMADANPGSRVAIDWGKWPHNTGPIITYLTSCGDTSCANFSSEGVQWFKIHQDGRKDGGGWLQADLMIGGLAQFNIPQNLARGYYLIRHEIIALHQAENEGMAEFYPSCAQIRVGGNRTGRPRPEDTVTFPGGYYSSHPGLYMPQGKAYSNEPYQFPGPPIATLVESDQNDSGSENSNSDNTTTPDYDSGYESGSGYESPPLPYSYSSRSGESTSTPCPPEYSEAATDATYYKPRRISRVMRGLGKE
ncbi:hypothetical protein AX16_009417 [Volvariella volvacea WC 439]|nr:hypothetical protein AX16_009417 [Volvariella volvacea WC 439]